MSAYRRSIDRKTPPVSPRIACGDWLIPRGANPIVPSAHPTRIESLLKAAGCKIVEGAGSSVTFEFNGRKMTLHRTHPGKEALRYRVLAVREIIERMGIKP